MIRMIVAIAGTSLLGLLLVGCVDSQPDIEKPSKYTKNRSGTKGKPKQGVGSLNPKKVSLAAVKRYDTNGDGKIQGEELKVSPALLSVLDLLDTDEDKALTASEISARIELWKGEGLKYDIVICPVTLDGKPLEGASVTLVPEPFLGKGFRKAAGETDKSGIATILLPGDSPMQIPFGFYRVEISIIDDSKETIPAKYNSATVLGIEVYRNRDRNDQSTEDVFNPVAFHLFSTDETTKQQAMMPEESTVPFEVNPVKTGEDAFLYADTNADNQIDATELEAAPALKGAIERLDLNADSVITPDEVDRRIESWRSLTDRQIVVSCQVTLDGKPLEGAKVYWIPVVYLGYSDLFSKGIKDEKDMVAIGLTDASGKTTPSLLALKTAQDRRSGIPCGLYRIAISKRVDDKETILERYNTKTILGHEVAHDVENLDQCVLFALESTE